MPSERERHKLRVIADQHGVRSELVCPPTGCEHPVDEGQVDESVRCWIETWAENEDLLLEHLAASAVLGEWEIAVEVCADGSPSVTILPPAVAARLSSTTSKEIT